MFKHVLVGVDGGPSGRDAIAFASRMREPQGVLTLAHVHPGLLHPGHAVTPGMVSELRLASHELLERERTSAQVSAELISVVSSTPGRGLHEQAEQQGADLIVVGSCGRGLLGRVMVGDDARAALNGAPCAVAVTARGYALDPKPIAKVGVGYEGSPESESALALARELVGAHGGRVSALEVVSLPSYTYSGFLPTITGEAIDEMLKEASHRMQELEGVDGRAVYGVAGEELASFGQTLDLLVIGSRGYGPWRRLVLGSTADYLERHARCSLLVLPRSAAGARAGQGQGPQAQRPELSGARG